MKRFLYLNLIPLLICGIVAKELIYPHLGWMGALIAVPLLWLFIVGVCLVAPQFLFALVRKLKRKQ